MAEARETDVTVAGGGPVGCALALALSQAPISVARVAGDSDAADRPIALSYGSRLILERLGVWTKIPNTPIRTVHVTREGFGRTVMHSSEHGLPALGYVSSYSEIVRQFAGRLPAALPAALRGWETRADGVVLKLSDETTLRTRLLVLADGGGNRDWEYQRDYRQQAIVAEVAVERPRSGVAWERFTTEGPLALLPHGSRYALIWTVRPATATSLLGLSDDDFLAALRNAFGGRMGGFKTVSRRFAFPLWLRRGSPSPGPRILSVGNAAQTLHPVAGQGFNLGLRDAWELAQMLLDAGMDEIGTDRFVTRYVRKRRTDRNATIGVTDFFTRIFSSPLPPLAAARGAGLALLDTCPPARNFLARRMIFGTRALP